MFFSHGKEFFMDFSQTVSQAIAGLPNKIDSAAQWAADILPADADFLTMLKYAALFFLAVLIVGVFIKAVCGRRSSLNRAISSGIGILMIYLVTAVVYAWRLSSLESYLAPLPFALFQGGRLLLLPIAGSPFSDLCREILGLLILSFCINLMDSLIPLGRSAISWILSRTVVIVLSMGLHLLAQWTAGKYLPGVLVLYAPTVLLVILVALLLLGGGHWLLSLALAAVNPILGGIYAFFFSSHVGKQITKSLLSTGFVTGFFLLAEKLGYRALSLTPEAILSCLPFALVLPLLWYALGHVF